jgi:ABC-2 type transport system permease protein
VRRVAAIMGREWRAYFFSPLAYVVMTAFLFLNGIIFWKIMAVLADPNAGKGQPMSLLFTNTFFWIFFLFFVPVIAMRLFPEERKSGTIESLLTAPVSETEVVLGKFAGALGFFLTLWAPTLIYVLFIRSYTKIDPGPVASGYVGVVLLAAYFIAVATFASTLTKNQILAAVLGFGMLIPIFSMGLFESAAGSKLGDWVSYLNLWEHMDDFSRGIVDSRRVVYYVSGTALFLFLSTVSLAAKKENP